MTPSEFLAWEATQTERYEFIDGTVVERNTAPFPTEALMGEAAPRVAMTESEFLLWEAQQTERHEFVDGQVYAMAGAEDRHVTVALKLPLRCGSTCAAHRVGRT